MRSPVLEVVLYPEAVEVEHVPRCPPEQPRELAVLPPKASLQVVVAARVPGTGGQKKNTRKSKARRKHGQDIQATGLIYRTYAYA